MISRKNPLLLVLFFSLLFGCTAPSAAVSTPTVNVSLSDTPAPAFTQTPTFTASPAPTGTRTPTPTYVPWHTLPPPTPFFFETDWTLAYTALVIDNPKDQFNEYHYEINTIQLNEKIPVKLTQKIGSFWKPRWSPDGKRLAFIKVDQNPTSLIILDLATGQIDEIANVWEYVWSRDGQRIVYCDYFIFQKPPFHCYLSQVDRLTESRKTLISEAWYVLSLNWSPTQDQILALAERDVGPREIYLIHLDGKTDRIPNGNPIGGDLIWHPGGQKIGYILSSDIGDAREIDLKTQKDIRLTYTWKSVGNIAWSPDGKYLAYASLDPDDIFSSIGMFLLNLESGKTTLVPQNGLRAIDPSWSPDGKYLAYLEYGLFLFDKPNQNQGCSIQVYELKTGISSRVLASGAECMPVSWKPMP